MKHPIHRPASRRDTLASSITHILTGSALLLAGAVVSSSAFAQEQATNLDRITVTGSNIPRTNTETPSPVQVVTRQEIDRTGKTTVAEYLQTLTADGSGSIPKTFGNGFAGGGAGISLRGLGAGSTLVLLNGRRMATYGLADDGQKVFTDLSTIPLDAVERVEVLKDGASAIYGSDAIAGVVNIILRSDFQGAILRGSYGVSGDGDGDAKKATLTAGTGDLATDGWNAFFSLDVGKTDAIKIGDRKNRKWIGTGDIRRWGYSAADAQFLGGAYLSGGTAGGVGPNGSVFDDRNVDDDNPAFLVALPGCANLTSIPGQTDATAQQQGCLWDPAQKFRDLSPEEKYINVFGRASFAFGEGGEIYTEIGYSKKETTFSNTPSGVSGGWGYPEGPVNANSGSGATVLGPDHPDNPIPGQASRLRYSAWDVGPRVTNNTNEFNRFLVGVKGNWGDWNYDTAYLHSGTDLINRRTGFLHYDNVRCALANPNCAGGVWRIGDNANLNSQALYDFISPEISARAKSSLDMFDFTVSRSLMDLKGGPLGLAMGTEWRKTSNSLTPQTFTDTGDIIGLGYSAYDGTQNVYAGYVELSAPVLEQLELSGALRYDKYESGEGKATPKLGVKWTPADWIALRASYAEGFRAPNPAENGDGGLAAFSNARDPVRCAISEAECTARSVAIITRPNSDLKPEESKSYSVGIVLQPTSSTSMTVDAWQIKRTNEIAQGSTADAIAAGNVLRDTNLLNGIAGTGSILAVNTQYINAASTRVRGIDTDIRQTFDIGPGQLEMDLQWSHVLKFERTDADVTVDYAGTHGNCDVTNCIGTPKDRINFGTTWRQGPWSVSGVANYISKLENKDRRGGDYLAFYEDGSPVEKISSFTTFDLSGRWNITEAFELNASVQNVFDRIAPLDPTTYGGVNYNPLHFSGAIGRYFTVGAKYTFN
ncbi:TonB-dependent receptor [Stenotrophomonas maltophilia]|uniref:TonB-dependent receptor n=2 Tax=Stenotrophomonas maltophilia TaxID=40324 RepID=A0AAP7L126_STEMA|nr:MULTISPECIES: TonB-dependent receptor [Stenotrophomonas]MBA0222308.1 TonB-dependent receptor [Stenotrophomonas maltophilia]MBH1665649.1 TonB-dependent receptor [Stenotrophomonas maltophilia]MBN4940148.1 TonB-dependent receptor [Stenotrophomonas maltophilia]MCO7398175.1 TonB-dependent receptor [Stenotrophomonas maltophilia]MCO7411376.1 TonB-dependent receptor [Stenotrophomonas maltophilia]